MTELQIERAQKEGKIPFFVISHKGRSFHTLARSVEHLLVRFTKCQFYTEISWEVFINQSYRHNSNIA